MDLLRGNREVRLPTVMAHRPLSAPNGLARTSPFDLDYERITRWAINPPSLADAAADARDGVGGGSHPGARSGRVKRGGLMEEATGDQAGHVGVEAGRLLGREERLFGGRNRLAVGLASAGLALVADTADREHDDGGKNAEDHDDDEEFHEGEATFTVGLSPLLNTLKHFASLFR